MAKRKMLTRKGSSKLFTATAKKVHGRNNHNAIMRGGIRL